MPQRALIFVNGNLPNVDAARRMIRPDDFIIAADGGARHALALGLIPSLVIGDLDSLDSADRGRLERAQTEIIQYPRDKDETDLELALLYLREAGYRRIRLIAALGGRLDQTLANLSLLAGDAFAALDVRVDDGVEAAFFARKQARIRGRIGDIVSLIPWGGDVAGVTTAGLRWPLRDAKLKAHKTRGISNEMLREEVEIVLESGLLLCVHSRNI